MRRTLFLMLLLVGAASRAAEAAEEPTVVAKPDAFKTLLSPDCSHCLVEANRRKEELRAENAQLATEIATLAADLTEAESPAYAERILREQRGYARDGDTVILPTFPQVTPTPAQPTAQLAPTSVPEPNWRRWATALFPPENTP